MNEAFSKFDLTGKTAVVTGGGTGLGYYMSRGLARSGAKVLITARREQVLKDAAAKLTQESNGNEVLYHVVDLASPDSVQRLGDHAIKRLGGVDIYIGNAGSLHFEKVESIAHESVWAMCQVSIAANVALVRAFIPGMRKKRWGRVIFSSSGSSIGGSAHEGCAMYSAVKGALNSFTRVAATETGHDGITFNSLLLGQFDSELVHECVAGLERQRPGAGKEMYDSMAAMTAVGRGGELPEIEGTIQYLASDAASYVTGVCLPIDGGLTIMIRPNPPPAERVYPKNL